MRHTARIPTFSSNKQNLCFDPFSAVRFWLFLAFWKAYNIRKRNAQVLKINFCKLFCLKKIALILYFLITLPVIKNFASIFAYLKKAWSMAFEKCIYIIFCKLDFAKKCNFWQFAIFLQIVKVVQKSLYVSFVIFGH